MVAGGLPTLQLLLDDGTGTFPYDITAYLRLVNGYSVERGRGDELSEVEAGKLSLTLDNTDGRFTLGSTIIATPSPIKVDQRIRLKVTANATVFTRSTVYVQSWPVEWPSGGDEFAVAAISGTCAQARAERWTLKSVPEQEILEDSPSAYYTLGEPAGATSAADSSGNQAAALTANGTGTAVVFGTATGPTTDGLTAAQFAGGQYLYNSTLTYGSTPGFIVAFASTSAAVQGIIPGLAMNAGTLVVSATTVGSGTYNDGLIHVVAIRYTAATTANVYIDGVLTNSGVAVAALSGVLGFGVGGPFAGGSVTFTGSIAHAAVFTTAPTGARLIAMSTAALTGFAGESDTARITRLAGYANLPIDTLDSSLTNVPFVDIAGASAMSAIQEVADAGMGLAFVNGTGALDYHNRNRVAAKTAPDVTIDANFLAEGTRFEVDMQGIINHYEVTAAGTSVTQYVDNTASQTTHGKYPQTKTYLVQTDQEALDRGNWTVTTHAEPGARVGSLAIDVLTMTAAQQAQMLGLEPDSWLRITGLPGQTPGSTTADFIVQGFAEGLNAGEWTLTLNAANKAVVYPTPWILDNATWSVLDSTTRVFV